MELIGLHGSPTRVTHLRILQVSDRKGELAPRVRCGDETLSTNAYRNEFEQLDYGVIVGDMVHVRAMLMT